MAGDWMVVRLDLKDDPSVRAIVKATGVPISHVCGGLVLVWGWFNGQTEDGEYNGGELSDIDTIAGIDGMGKAMQSSGWLDVTDTGVRVPRWETWNSEGAKKRLKDSQRKRRERATSDIVPKNSDRNATTGQDRQSREREEKGKGSSEQINFDSITACLAAWRIGEPSRSQLIEAGLTVPVAVAAWEASGEGNARNRKGVFVAACKRHLGLETRGKTTGGQIGRAVNAIQKDIDLAADLDRARRLRGGG